jgi:hypothetical protein
LKYLELGLALTRLGQVSNGWTARHCPIGASHLEITKPQERTLPSRVVEFYL